MAEHKSYTINDGDGEQIEIIRRSYAPFEEKHTKEIGEFLYTASKQININDTESLYEYVCKHPKHIIYKIIFKKPDKEAIYQYRISVLLSIKRHIEIIHIPIIKTEKSYKTKLFFPVTVNNKGIERKEFRNFKDVYENEDYRKQTCTQALKELDGWFERYYNVFPEIKNEADIIIRKYV